MAKAVYVPWLHMHQPLVWWKVDGEEKLISNLEKMLLSRDHGEVWNAKLMLRAYNNPAKYVKQLKEEGYEPKIILDYSGILLESLKNFDKKIEVHGERISNVVKQLKEVLTKFPTNIEIAGTAYSHCYFPSTPEEDWSCQIEEWRNAFREIFGKRCLERVRGFWFPEMGVPGFENKLAKLVKAVKEHYEWCILPLQAVEGYEQLSYKKRIQISSQPHMLTVGGESIPVIFRVPTDFIDQSAGCDVDCVCRKAREAGEIFDSSIPALVVPASDGENGNVMMNEFFPNTFVPFFKDRANSVSSMTVTEFLHTYYERDGKIVPKSEIKLKTIGASWVGGHKFWLEGTERLRMVEDVERLSKEFHEVARSTKNRERLEEAKRALLVAETSCYVYWGTDFWFDQGRKTIEFARRKIMELE
jgi:hypothetical protein